MRILIWLDHMGLRVATLVNLSFLGMDKLDQRLARLLAPAATAALHSRGRQTLHHLGAPADPFLYSPRHGLGLRLEHRPRPFAAHAQGGSARHALALPLSEKLLVAAGAVAALHGVLRGPPPAAKPGAASPSPSRWR